MPHSSKVPEEPMWRWIAIAVLLLLAVVGVGLLLANHLAPPATGRRSHALPLQPAQTEIDRELSPLLAANPGKTGAIFLTDGVDAFAARAISARKAGRSLDLQYFIWHDDLTGRLLASEVYDAAERGVRVRILLDDMNALGLDPHLLAMDAHPNIELRLYNPFRNRGGVGRAFELLRRLFSINHRMHNKAWIADGRVAIIGGRNIGEQYFSADSEVNFRDLDLLLLGPAVQQASTIFDSYWNSAAAVPIATLGARDPEALRKLLADVVSRCAWRARSALSGSRGRFAVGAGLLSARAASTLERRHPGRRRPAAEMDGRQPRPMAGRAARADDLRRTHEGTGDLAILRPGRGRHGNGSPL